MNSGMPVGCENAFNTFLPTSYKYTSQRTVLIRASLYSSHYLPFMQVRSIRPGLLFFRADDRISRLLC